MILTPTAKIDIVNQALMELGSLPVIQVSDTQQATLINAKIDLLFPALLAQGPWNFAIKYISDSTPLTTQFSPDFLYAYQLPSDFGRFFKWITNIWPLYYEFADGLLLTSIFPVQYYYVTNNIDFDKISILFYRALAIYVAADVAPVLTNNTVLAQYLYKKFEGERDNAYLQNDMDRLVEATPFNEYDRQTYI
jgi:hypothetical protein